MTGQVGGFDGINQMRSHDLQEPSEKVKTQLSTPPKKIVKQAITVGATLGAVVIGSGAAFLVSPTWVAIGALLGTGAFIGVGLTAALIASHQVGKTLSKAAQSKMACTIANKMTDSFKKIVFSKGIESDLRSEFTKELKTLITTDSQNKSSSTKLLANSKLKSFFDFLIENKTKNTLSRELSNYLNEKEKQIVFDLYDHLNHQELELSPEVENIEHLFDKVDQGFLALVYQNNEEFRNTIEHMKDQYYSKLEDHHQSIIQNVVPKLIEKEADAQKAYEMINLMQVRKKAESNIKELLEIASTLRKNGRETEANQRILDPIDRQLKKIERKGTSIDHLYKLTRTDCAAINLHYRKIMSTIGKTSAHWTS